MYYSFDRRFDDREQAVTFAKEVLAKLGLMVCVGVCNVPDCKCGRCGGLLLDFQRDDRMYIGEAGDMMDCFWHEAHGLICKNCADGLAESHIECCGLNG